MDFNKNFYQSNFSKTREQAESLLLSLGYNGFQFNNSSFTNGASFYFTSKDGKQIRVSDHPLTGNRAFETIQVSFPMSQLLNPVKIRAKYISGEISKKEYKSICNENGFLFKP